ncbi:hypothetical protein T05_12814 [Trichinella murrelli]|uniref:Uncharacterized protein n=1 Tax=Trichinella murrelli TaxID=144512 RepID=A0A0V0SWV1_9BILA|nr:hypothetical protein T05_12814 [Trichinella murrelli]
MPRKRAVRRKNGQLWTSRQEEHILTIMCKMAT